MFLTKKLTVFPSLSSFQMINNGWLADLCMMQSTASLRKNALCQSTTKTDAEKENEVLKYFFRYHQVSYWQKSLLHIHASIQISVFSPFLEPDTADHEQINSDYEYSVLCAFNFISCYLAYPHSPFSHFIPISQSLRRFPCSKFAFTVFCANCYVKLWPRI